MKKFLLILTLLMLACTTIACNEPEKCTVSGEGVETIIVENTINET